MKNMKLSAAFDTVIMILVGLASIGIAYVVFATVPIEIIFYGLCAAFVVLMLNVVYQINLSRRKYQEMIDRLKE
jgi:hypothetical protein